MSEPQGRKLTVDERKAQRAKRVLDKKNAVHGGGTAVVKKTEAVEEHMISKEQIKNSRDVVDGTKTQADTLISDVAVDRADSENRRRRKEAQQRDERYSRVENELKESQRINQEIEEAWGDVSQKSIPQELYAAISSQYKKASHLLGVKDELIKFLQTNLKNKDEDYVEVLSQHQEDINVLLKRMNDTFQGFLQTVSRELRTIEDTFMKERQELLDKNHEEIELLFEKRRKMEVVIMESKQIREKKCAQELLEIRNRDAEDYNSLKIDLENSIQIFEQQLEEMRATYQLNSEKLEYNHSVLIERDLENKATVEHHRQRLRRLKENLSALIQRFHKQDHRFKTENNALTEDYKRMTEQFKDLQKKYAHFVAIDTKKYADVWEMNEEHVMELVRKVLKASQIIHEQILGLEWKPPLLPVDLQKVIHPVTGFIDVGSITSAMIFHAGQATMQAQQNAAAAAAAQAAQLAATGGVDAQGKPLDKTTAAAAASASTASTTSAANGGVPTGSKYTPQQIKTVMDLLSSEISFLLDSRIQETVAALADRSSSNPNADAKELQAEQDMYRADGIMSAIGVEDREDLDSLVSIFYEGAQEGDVKPTVHPNDVAKLIKEFVVKRQQVKTKGGSAAAAAAAAAAGGGADGSSSALASIGLKQHDSVLNEKKARRKERERLFWSRLGTVINEPTQGVWTALERWQHQYNTLLEERATLIDETTELAKQNEELKILLQEYLGSKVNQELEIPPTRLIRVNQQ